MQTQPYAFSYKPINGTNYNILEGPIRLFEDKLKPGHYPLIANCTLSEPPPYKLGLAISFNTAENKWEYIENHIGEHGYLNDVPYTIYDYGPRPKGFTTEISDNKKMEIRTGEVKSIIKSILHRTDSMMMPDYHYITKGQRELMKEFRTSLRNLELNADFPFVDQTIPIPKWPLKDTIPCPYTDLYPLIFANTG